MKDFIITGGGGVQLHAIGAGEAQKAIVFIHGISQSVLTWRRQFESPLADDFHLIAVDLRGHGLSEKPREGYADSRLWADDVHALIKALDLDRPILCGWSYGAPVILDYLRHYGEDNIRGVNFIGGVTKLGSEEAASVLTPEFLSLIPGFFSTDVEQSVHSIRSLLRLCFALELAPEDLYRILGYNLSVPPYVRQGAFSRAFDNDDLLPALRKPVLITHGVHDAVVKPEVIEKQFSAIPVARIHRMDTGMRASGTTPHPTMSSCRGSQTPFRLAIRAHTWRSHARMGWSRESFRKRPFMAWVTTWSRHRCAPLAMYQDIRRLDTLGRAEVRTASDSLSADA